MCALAYVFILIKNSTELSTDKESTVWRDSEEKEAFYGKLCGVYSFDKNIYNFFLLSLEEPEVPTPFAPVSPGDRPLQVGEYFIQK